MLRHTFSLLSFNCLRLTNSIDFSWNFSFAEWWHPGIPTPIWMSSRGRLLHGQQNLCSELSRVKFLQRLGLISLLYFGWRFSHLSMRYYWDSKDYWQWNWSTESRNLNSLKMRSEEESWPRQTEECSQSLNNIHYLLTPEERLFLCTYVATYIKSLIPNKVNKFFSLWIVLCSIFVDGFDPTSQRASARLKNFQQKDDDDDVRFDVVMYLVSWWQHLMVPYHTLALSIDVTLDVDLSWAMRMMMMLILVVLKAVFYVS